MGDAMHRLAGPLIVVATVLSASSAAQQAIQPPHRVFEVEIADPLVGNPNAKGPFSGRLIVRLSPFQPETMGMPAYPAGASLTPEQQQRRLEAYEGMKNVSFSMAALRPFPGLFAAAMDVSDVMPGDVIEVDVDKIATPAAFSSIAPGEYFATAVLDIHDDFALTNSIGADDLSSHVQRIALGDARPRLTIRTANFPAAPWGHPVNGQMSTVAGVTRDVDFVSPSLSAFHGQPTHIRGYVLLPPDYSTSSETYPVVYDFAPFGWSSEMIPVFQVLQRHAPMYGGSYPPMIWVMLDPSGPTGVHGFTDGARHGPWGKALAEELVPWLERQYRADRKALSRLLFGNGAGGWTALWLQAKHPKLFGGAWAQSPDSVDFRDFFGTDIYAGNANFFFDAEGKPKTMFHERGRTASHEIYSARDISGLETVYGSAGQLAAFEGRFSPRDTNGRPRSLFDRSTGAIDVDVARYWGEHYDLARYLHANWSELRGDLDGKLHIAVGEWDGAGRHRAVEKLSQTLNTLGAKMDINVLFARTENELYAENRFVADMYRLARPNSTWTAPRPSRTPVPLPSRPILQPEPAPPN